MTRARRIVRTAVGLVAAAAVSVAALAQADSETGAASPESSRPGIASLVGALSEPRTDEDVVPADAAAQAEGAGPAGIAVKESVLATTGSGGWVLYLIPATNEVCVSLVDPLGGSSLSCKTAEALRAGSGVPSAVMTGCVGPPPEVAPPTCDAILLYGIVPDGVEQVAVDVRRGNTARADVVNNVYTVRVPLSYGPTALRYSGERGSVTQALPY